eukprot:TRINITY_DN1621_c0_g1_i1.p1 TRINITY_DN1621_c0_g1~~TRINITY_DN1621_c0_g1_i1.p1  ORF type:complete len:460 (+),score=125.09 TRINITY_DN1621_c0_g1_i1:2147-3526(+)
MSIKSTDIQITSDHRETIKKIFNRFSQLELHEIYPTTKKFNKQQILNILLLDRFHLGLSYYEVARLDFEYFKRHENHQKRWRAYELKFKLLDGEERQCVTNPSELEEIITRELSSFFPNYTYCSILNDGILIRIQLVQVSSKSSTTTTINNNNSPNNSYTTSSLPVTTTSPHHHSSTLPLPVGGSSSSSSSYPQQRATWVYYFPHANFLFISGMKASEKDFLIHSLSTSLNCYSISQHNLKGRDIRSLKELLFFQKSQGLYKAYREGNTTTTTPLKSTTTTSSKIFKNPLDRSELQILDTIKGVEIQQHNNNNNLVVANNIVNEKEDEEEEEYTTSSSSLPKLDYVELLFSASNNNNDDDDDEEESREDQEWDVDVEKNYEVDGGGDVVVGLPASIRFNGEDILEGLKDCLKYNNNIAKLPLPPELKYLPSLGKNTIEVKLDQKRKTQMINNNKIINVD